MGKSSFTKSYAKTQLAMGRSPFVGRIDTDTVAMDFEGSLMPHLAVPLFKFIGRLAEGKETPSLSFEETFGKATASAPIDVDINVVLDFRTDMWDLPECTIREYLVALAQGVWHEHEGFSGKRPFGNSGWKTDVMFALADGGFITGERDEDGNWCDADWDAGEEIIKAAFAKIASSR